MTTQKSALGKLPWNATPLHDQSLPHWRDAFTPGCTACDRGIDPLAPPVVMDYPTAWAFVRDTDPTDHHEKCSWRTEQGALLCDCAVLNNEYARRKAAMSR